jgi:hypothetical protein
MPGSSEEGLSETTMTMREATRIITATTEVQTKKG